MENNGTKSGTKNSDRFVEQLKAKKRKIETSKNFELDYHDQLEKRDHMLFMSFFESEEFLEIKREMNN